VVAGSNPVVPTKHKKAPVFQGLFYVWQVGKICSSAPCFSGCVPVHEKWQEAIFNGCYLAGPQGAIHGSIA
jgi:hypothetical protein